MPDAPTDPPGHVSFLHKLRILLACGISIVLLYYAGWYVVGPPDDRMGISFLAGDQAPLKSLPMMCLLSVAIAAIATAVTGRRLPEAGLFATAVGIAVLALRGGSMQSFLAYLAADGTGDRQSLMFTLALDGLLWSGMIAACWFTTLWVQRWLIGDAVEPEDRSESKVLPESSVSPKWRWIPVLATAFIACLLIWQTIARTDVATIARGQVVASIAGGLFLGSMLVRSSLNLHDIRWYLLAVPVVLLVGYSLGYLNADLAWASESALAPYAELATTAPHALARPLPVEYVAVGTAAVVAGFWSGHKVQAVTEEGRIG